MKNLLKKILILGLSTVMTFGAVVPSFAEDLTKEELDAVFEELDKLRFTEYTKGQITKEIIPDDIFRDAVNNYIPERYASHLDHGENGKKIRALDSDFGIVRGLHPGYPEGMKSIEGYKNILDKSYINEYFENELSENARKYAEEVYLDVYSYNMELPSSVEGELDVSGTRIQDLLARGKITKLNVKDCNVVRMLYIGGKDNMLDELPDLSDCEILESCTLSSDDNNPNLLQNQKKLEHIKLEGESTRNINLDNLPNLLEVDLDTKNADVIDLSNTTQLTALHVRPFGIEDAWDDYRFDYWKPKEEVDKIKKVREIKLPKYNDDSIKMDSLKISGNSLLKIDLSNVIFGFNPDIYKRRMSPVSEYDKESRTFFVKPILGTQYIQDQYEYYIQDGKYVLDLKPILGERRYLDKVKVLNQHDGRYGAKYDKEKGLLTYDKLPEPGNVNDDYMGYTLMCPDKTQKEWPMYVKFTNLKEGKAPYVSSIRDEATGVELKGEGLKSDMSLNVTPKKDMKAEDVRAAQKAIVKGVPKGYGIFNMYDIKLMQNGEEIKLKQPTVLTIPIADGMNNKVIAVKDYDSDDSVYPSRFITGDTKLGNSNKNYGHTVKDGKVEMTVERLGVLGLIGSEKDVEEAQKEEADKNLNGAKALKLAEINKLTLGETKGYTEESVKKAEAKLESMKQEAKSNVAKAKTVAEVEAVKLPDVKAARDLLETEEEAERKLQEIKGNAKKQLNEVDKTLYREAEQKKITEIVESALEKINKADSKEDVENSLSDALKKIGSLKTVAQYELEEEKEAKIAEITNATLGDTKGYTEESVKKAEAKLAELKKAAVKRVNEADSIEKVKNVSLPNVDEVRKLLKTPEQVLEEEKEAKIAEITNATLGDTKGYTEESVKKAEAKLAELKADLIEKVKAAKNIDEINALKISSIVSEAEKLLVTASGESGSSDKTDKPSTNANADAKSPATADDSNMLVLISTAVTALIAGLFATMIKRKNH